MNVDIISAVHIDIIKIVSAIGIGLDINNVIVARVDIKINRVWSML